MPKEFVYQIPEAGEVALIVYSSMGSQVRVLVHGGQKTGTHQVTWDGKDDLGNPVPGGIFFYVFKSKGMQKRGTLRLATGSPSPAESPAPAKAAARDTAAPGPSRSPAPASPRPDSAAPRGSRASAAPPKVIIRPDTFRTTTERTFQLSEAGEIALSIFTPKGDRVRTLIQGRLEAGTHKVTWDGKDHFGNDVPNGMYICIFRRSGMAQRLEFLWLQR